MAKTHNPPEILVPNPVTLPTNPQNGDVLTVIQDFMYYENEKDWLTISTNTLTRKYSTSNQEILKKILQSKQAKNIEKE